MCNLVAPAPQACILEACICILAFHLNYINLSSVCPRPIIPQLLLWKDGTLVLSERSAVSASHKLWFSRKPQCCAVDRLCCQPKGG